VRIYNFSAGPATLPLPVLEEAQRELLDWAGSGTSVMEISHRSKAFLAVAREAEADLRELLAIPPEYKVLFLSGGATLQFASIPLNLVGPGDSVAYVNTGHWSDKALKEARRYATVTVAADAKDSNYTTIPEVASWQVDPAARYLHYTPNETIQGVEFPFIPDVPVPLVADMSSNILSAPLEVSRFGLIYAGAQKNIGPSGLTIVIVREDLLGRAQASLPSVMNYSLQAAEGSMLNTPATFPWYLAGRVFKWLKREGGLAAMGRNNAAKAALLYDYIDASGFYSNPVVPAYRSRMNVPFRLADAALEGLFASEAAAEGLRFLEGHRAVGGMRASLYNAMPIEGVHALIAFMKAFVVRHG